MYNIIANINNLLYYCDLKKEVFATEHYYEIIKGEALGLRAFLHFDLLRMYGPIYKENPNAKRIAYRTEFNREAKEMQSSNVVVDSIIADLKKAEILLEESDPCDFQYAENDYDEESVLPATPQTPVQQPPAEAETSSATSADGDSSDEDWEWEYVDENGNEIPAEGGDDEDWEWEYVEDDTPENKNDNNPQ